MELKQCQILARASFNGKLKLLVNSCFFKFIFRISTMFSLNSSASDNSLVSIYPFGDQVYACGEMPFIHKIDLQSLETLDRLDLHQQINIVNHTSHPHIMEDCKYYILILITKLVFDFSQCVQRGIITTRFWALPFGRVLPENAGRYYLNETQKIEN